MSQPGLGGKENTDTIGETISRRLSDSCTHLSHTKSRVLRVGDSLIGIPPSTSLPGEGVEVASPSTVTGWLDALERKILELDAAVDRFY